MVHGTWYGTVWHGVRYGTVCDIVFWQGMMVLFAIWTNHGMGYDKLVVWHDGTAWWMYYTCKDKYCLVVWYVLVYKVCESRKRHMNIICGDPIYRSLERTINTISSKI